MNPTATPDDAEGLAAVLSDVFRAEPLTSFPAGPDVAESTGMYSWWADAEAASLIGRQLRIPVPSLIYAGQAGATRWPSGAISTATLLSRIRGNHIRGNASSSTFRLTLSALLLEPLGLRVGKPGRLLREDNTKVSAWMGDHLSIVIVPFNDRDKLASIEEEVLDMLDPPLNLASRPPTPSRALLKNFRKRITSPT